MNIHNQYIIICYLQACVCFLNEYPTSEKTNKTQKNRYHRHPLDRGGDHQVLPTGHRELMYCAAGKLPANDRSSPDPSQGQRCPKRIGDGFEFCVLDPLFLGWFQSWSWLKQRQVKCRKMSMLQHLNVDMWCEYNVTFSERKTLETIIQLYRVSGANDIQSLARLDHQISKSDPRSKPRLLEIACRNIEKTLQVCKQMTQYFTILSPRL